MSWRPSLIAIPAIPLSLHPKTHMLRKTKGKKAYAIPLTNLDTRAAIGNWRRLRKWIRSRSIRRKPVLSVKVCWLKVREDNFLPWNDIRCGRCPKFVLWFPSLDSCPVGVPFAGYGYMDKPRVAGRGGEKRFWTPAASLGGHPHRPLSPEPPPFTNFCRTCVA
jgi:hypothetical protein